MAPGLVNLWESRTLSLPGGLAPAFVLSLGLPRVGQGNEVLTEVDSVWRGLDGER